MFTGYQDGGRMADFILTVYCVDSTCLYSRQIWGVLVLYVDKPERYNAGSVEGHLSIL